MKKQKAASNPVRSACTCTWLGEASQKIGPWVSAPDLCTVRSHVMFRKSTIRLAIFLCYEAMMFWRGLARTHNATRPIRQPKSRCGCSISDRHSTSAPLTHSQWYHPCPGNEASYAILLIVSVVLGQCLEALLHDRYLQFSAIEATTFVRPLASPKVDLRPST